MIDKHLLKLRARDDISEAEENLIRSFVSPPIEVAAKKPSSALAIFCRVRRYCSKA